jgi:tetratricopeptide (TPR) repeat protein
MKTIAVMLAGIALAVMSLPAQDKQPRPKSQKEVEALMAIQNAQTPDARIAAVENLIQKFADTEFKSWALSVATDAARQKGDSEKVVLFAERTLDSDPKNFQAMIMLSAELAQKTREHDLDKEEKLGRAEKYAKEAIVLVKDAAKPNPNVPDDQWEAAKKDIAAQAYESLGIAAMARKKYDDAVTQFKTSIETSANQDPATKVRLATAYNNLSKWDDALTTVQPVLADPQVHPSIKQFAEREKERAAKGKESK